MRTFFEPSELLKFTQAVAQYIKDTMKYSMVLTANEIAQLSWYMDSTTVTPEATEKNIQEKLHFEIKRGLARRYCFELLLRGDDDSYLEFISAQRDEGKLSREDFDRLSSEAKSLSDDEKLAIKTTCFLTISEKTKTVAIAPEGETFSNDSEEFLSQICGNALQLNQAVFPIFNGLKSAQLSLLQKAFWPNMHFRHMMFTEGGVNMTKTFSQGVLSGQFTSNDFKIWKWRWLTNLFGFQLGKGAKCFDSEMSKISGIVFDALERTLKITSENTFLQAYLSMRSTLAGFAQSLPENEKLFLGHLATYFHQINIVKPELGEAVFTGYRQFCAENTGNNLAEAYVRHCFSPTAITPTYAPAVLNNAFLHFKKSMDEKSAVALATQFMCQFLQSLYVCPMDQRISCMALAQEISLRPILEVWLDNHNAVQFEFSDGIAKKSGASMLPICKG